MANTPDLSERITNLHEIAESARNTQLASIVVLRDPHTLQIGLSQLPQVKEKIKASGKIDEIVTDWSNTLRGTTGAPALLRLLQIRSLPPIAQNYIKYQNPQNIQPYSTYRESYTLTHVPTLGDLSYMLYYRELSEHAESVAIGLLFGVDLQRQVTNITRDFMKNILALRWRS